MPRPLCVGSPKLHFAAVAWEGFDAIEIRLMPPSSLPRGALGPQLAFILTGSEASEHMVFSSVHPTRAIVPKKSAPTLPNGIQAVIAGRSSRSVRMEHDQAFQKQGDRIERMFGHFEINRAIATQYDQLACSFLRMVHIATARYRFEFVHAAWGA